MKRKILAVGIIALVTIIAVAFWPQPPISPAERQVKNWLKKGYAGGIGGKDWDELEGFGADTLPFLVGVLTNRSTGVPRIFREACRKVPYLSRHMEFVHDSEAERFAAECAIFNFPSKEHSAMVTALIPVLRDEREMVRERAAETLSARMCRADTNWLPDLAARLEQETNRYVRLRLAIAILKIRPDSKVVSEIVRPALNDTNSFIRSVAQEQLPEIEKLAADSKNGQPGGAATTQ
ncbi:MAG: HEAT repeat domain-containing protein [Limisphaerales bacterium]